MSDYNESLAGGEPLATPMAQEPIAFAFHFDEHPEPEAGTESMAMLCTAVQELQLLPPDGNLEWSQGYWNQQPGQTIYGRVDQVFPDGSTLHVSIDQALGEPLPKDGILRDNLLYISLRTAHATDHEKSVRVGYYIERDSDVLMCETNKALGAQVIGALALYEQLDVVDPLGEADFEEMLGALFTEAQIAHEGLAIDLDNEIEALRESSELYRIVSDDVRNDLANVQLAEQLGIPSSRSVGVEEAQWLINLLRSV